MNVRNLEMAPSDVSRLVHAVRSRERTEFRPMMLTMAIPIAPLLVVWVNCTANATCGQSQTGGTRTKGCKTHKHYSHSSNKQVQHHSQPSLYAVQHVVWQLRVVKRL